MLPFSICRFQTSALQRQNPGSPQNIITREIRTVIRWSSQRWILLMSKSVRVVLWDGFKDWGNERHSMDAVPACVCVSENHWSVAALTGEQQGSAGRWSECDILWVLRVNVSSADSLNRGGLFFFRPASLPSVQHASCSAVSVSSPYLKAQWVTFSRGKKAYCKHC